MHIPYTLDVFMDSGNKNLGNGHLNDGGGIDF